VDLLNTYLPLFVLLIFVLALLFATTNDRDGQIIALKDFGFAINRFRKKTPREFLSLLTIKRAVITIVLVHLLTYAALYNVLQNKISSLLIEKEIEKAQVQSLILPYLAFFQSSYDADTGFKYSKRRTRANIQVTGHLWSELNINVTESDLAKISQVVGKKFVFSFMTDTKKLTPEIHRHMKREIASKEIDAYELERYDNRGPYIVVVLSEKNRAKDHEQIANAIAKRVYEELTVNKKLMVNYVYLKIIDPDLYLNSNRISQIARGGWGNLHGQ